MIEDPGSLPKRYKYINENLLSQERYRQYKVIKERIDKNRSSTESVGSKVVEENAENDKENEDIHQLLSPHDIEEQADLDEATKDRLFALFTEVWYKWNSLKPPRVHHWSQCKRWIVKMDHHCPWMNNWIGIRNIKHFILFLIYSELLTLYIISVNIGCLTHWIYDDWDAFDLGGVFEFMIVWMLLCTIFFSYLYHLWFIASSTTSLTILQQLTH